MKYYKKNSSLNNKNKKTIVTTGSVIITVSLALTVATVFMYGYIIEKNYRQLQKIAEIKTERALVHVLLQDTLYSDMNLYSTFSSFASAYVTFSEDLFELLESPLNDKLSIESTVVQQSKTVLTNLMNVTEKRVIEIDIQITRFKEKNIEYLPGPYNAKSEEYTNEKTALYQLAVQLESLPIYYGDAWDISFQNLIDEVMLATNRQTLIIKVISIIIPVCLAVLIVLLTYRFRKMFKVVHDLSINLEIEIEKRSAELNKVLYELSITDELTGLYNRRYYNTVLEAEWKICVREKKPISVILIDIDYFKSYNDYYGHIAGDIALTRIASAIKSSMNRVGDIAARYGGEEFVVLLPNTDEEGSYQIAQNINKRISDFAIDHNKSLVSTLLTVSMGISTTYPVVGDDATALIKNSDERLYQAKENGRNRIVATEQDDRHLTLPVQRM